MQVLEFGRQLLFLAAALTGVIAGLAALGIVLKDRRLVVGARVGFYALFLLVAASSACLVHGFIAGEYNNQYIFRYSERALGTPFKIAGLWAGLDGSMLFWTLILCAYAAVAALQHRWSARHPVGRRLEPWVYMVLATIIGFFVLVVCNVTNPFRELTLDMRIAQSADGIVPDGRGLNPQLENYWMAIHPPTLYLGLVGLAIPFAFSMAALLAGEMGDYWIKITRRWTLVAWSFLTFGIILGGLWAYEMLGWGGYWAWDPVENASILPWFVGTAFLHSVMVQERRDMLRGWNVFLVTLTFFATIIATYMTRSGVVDSVHAFAEGEVGKYFIPFMLAIALGSAFLMGLRGRFLRGRHQLESFWSREAAFFFNNLVLLALALTVYLLSMAGKISHDFFATKVTAREATYNLVTTPLFLLLLFLTGIGPQLGWVKTSPAILRKRILVPSITGAAVCLALLPYWIANDTVPSPFDAEGSVARAQTVPETAPPAPPADANPETGPAMAPAGMAGDDDESGLGSGPGFLLVEKYHYYSTLLGIGLAVFILATIAAELRRGVLARVRHRGERVPGATLNVIVGNNRRYGGYIVHVGIAVLAIGVIWSSNFRIKQQMTIERGVPVKIGESGWSRLAEKLNLPTGEPYTVTWKESETLPAGTPYSGERYRFDIHRGERKLATLLPELRYYPKFQDSPLISVPAITRGFYNDYYIHYTMEQRRGNASASSFTIFINPLVNWIWTGAVLMLAGGLFAALPMPRRRIGLAG